MCTNYIDLELYPVTTTTTTTLPLEFLLSYECDGETVIQITADTITGGAPGYYPATTFFYDEASALANTSWSAFSIESISYGTSEPNNTFWVAIIDSAGNIAVNSITTNCLPPVDFTLTSSCDGFGNATLSMTSYTGGSGSYESGNGFFLSEAAALANASWIPGTSLAIGIGSTPGTYWMVIRDTLGTLKAKDIVVDCTTTTTTTTIYDNYQIEDCITLSVYTLAKTYVFGLGDVVQYQVGVPGAGLQRCGTIISTSTNLPATASLYSANAYSCGDTVHCP